VGQRIASFSALVHNAKVNAATAKNFDLKNDPIRRSG
jgi:hypothetical protein